MNDTAADLQPEASLLDGRLLGQAACSPARAAWAGNDCPNRTLTDEGGHPQFGLNSYRVMLPNELCGLNPPSG